MNNLNSSKANFGTAPVFFTAISTILGAIMFLRFGYAVGSVGFLGTLGIIIFSHLITIPTAMAIAEIATNQKVEGGGEYYIISRSFGISVGAAIGIALYLSQAISVAFYIIAFAESIEPMFSSLFGLDLEIRSFYKIIIRVVSVILLSILIIKKGSVLGMKALYIVIGVLFISLILFFMGSSNNQLSNQEFDWFNTVNNPNKFFLVFAIIFPAFTGMTAGVGLSGDLKNPKKSIPLGTLLATVVGMIIYVLLAYKLSTVATPEELVSDQFIMMKIAVWEPIIPLGLACATISSAIGSILVAPRTLQALGGDNIFPRKLNVFLKKGSKTNNDPINSTIITSIIAVVFVLIEEVNDVAKIISVFFMITYGSLCIISFLQHFAADPSYRPSFKSKWYVSLIGALLCVYLIFKMSPEYAVISIVIMILIYVVIAQTNKSKEGIAKIFQGVMFQVSRKLQIFLQKVEKEEENWRPSIICISENFNTRPAAFQLLRWLSHRFGFGTYIHFIKGYLSKETHIKAKEEIQRLLKTTDFSKSNIYVDTLISPSFTSAVAQSMQLPSVSGKELNMILFEYNKRDLFKLEDIIDNFTLVKSAEFDVCILGSSDKEFGFMHEIHIWLTPKDIYNSNLMILLGYIIMGHPDWKKAEIKIFAVIEKDNNTNNEKASLIDIITEGRLPISPKNIKFIQHEDDINIKTIINEKSSDADLTILGFRTEALKQLENKLFGGYDSIGNVLFVNSSESKDIE